jgi:hypothetical protein
MDISDGIAIAAATISMVETWSAHRAAISAERSARSAEHANKIALHNERLNIYKGLQEFHLMLRTRGIICLTRRSGISSIARTLANSISVPK